MPNLAIIPARGGSKRIQWVTKKSPRRKIPAGQLCTSLLGDKILVGGKSDKIMYANNIQTEIDYENEKCHLIDEVYVLAIL